MWPHNQINNIQCLIVDDQDASSRILSQYVDRTEGLQVSSTMSGGLAAFDYLQAHPEIHLIFLDVEMPSLSGFDFLNMLDQGNSNLLPLVILTTGHTEYATHGYHFDRVVGFLQKVVSYQDFLVMVKKAQRMLSRYSEVTVSKAHQADLISNPSLQEDYRHLKSERDMLLKALQVHSKRGIHYSEDR
ncbi:MAG: response regulator [Cyclobacteriaceae bacterium]